MTQVEARSLPPPWLKYHNTEKQKYYLPKDGQWTMINKTILFRRLFSVFLKATLGRTLVRGRREGDWTALFCKKRRCGVGAESLWIQKSFLIIMKSLRTCWILELDQGAYANLEQFEKDVLLISSYAMQYNAPDSIYFRQTRSIQELAKNDFEI
ncbi:hypothetical protein ACLB2K_000212 [Fragaria x ananassa]